MRKIRYDYHLHTIMCGHARGTMYETVKSAVEKGFVEIGFADHLPLTYTEDRTLSMSEEDLPRYVEEVLRLKDLFKDEIVVRLGIEADYYPPRMERVERMLSAYPFEYVIGSIHYLRGWIFDDPRYVRRFDELDIDEFCLEYFEAMKEMISAGLFDVVAHPDIVKKFGHRAKMGLEPVYRDILTAIRNAGICYEVNTAGLRWPAEELYPDPLFLRLGAELGVPVTVGSDSHCPDDVGKDFDKALSALLESGYTSIAVLSDRSWKQVDL